MYYFAYGSNMNLDHMRRMCGWHFHVLGVGMLMDYEFGPDKRGYSNIRPKQGSKVFGVLYDLEQKGLDALDEFEGYPQVFNRIEVTIEDISKAQYKAWVYVENEDQFGGSEIKQEYLKRVLAGAQENRLPETWIKFLSSFQNPSGSN